MRYNREKYDKARTDYGKTFFKMGRRKKWFVNQERDRLLLDFNRYIEPFLGGGSVFFILIRNKQSLAI